MLFELWIAIVAVFNGFFAELIASILEAINAGS